MKIYSDDYLKTTREFWDHSYWPVIRESFHARGAILDVGCGNGENTFKVLGDTGPEDTVIGLDKDPLILQSISDSRITPKNGDCLELPFPDNTFNLSFCNTLLCVLDSRRDEPKKAVSEMIRVTRTRGDVVCIEPAQGFGCGVRLMEFRPSNGDDLEHDQFWSQVRYAYLRGFRTLTGQDIHIGVRCISLLDSNGLRNIWTKSFYHIIRGIDHSGNIDEICKLESLLNIVQDSWYPKPFKEILKSGGLSDEQTCLAVEANQRNWDSLRGAITNLREDKNRESALDILRQMLIMVPQIAVGGTKV